MLIKKTIKIFFKNNRKLLNLFENLQEENVKIIENFEKFENIKEINFKKLRNK